MSRLGFIFVFLCFGSVLSGDESTSRTPESNAFGRLYSRLLSSERNLLQARISCERQRLKILQDLLNEGNASWLEFRKQKAIANQLEAKLAAYNDFIHKIDNKLEQLDTPKILVNWQVAQIPLTKVTIKAPGLKPIRKIDFSKWTKSFQNELERRIHSRDRLRVQTNSLPIHDSWREGFSARLAIAENEVKVLESRMKLFEYTTDQIQRDNNSGANNKYTKTQSVIKFNESLLQSWMEKGDAYLRLVEHCEKIEAERLKKLDELSKTSNMTSGEESLALKKRLTLLGELRNKQKAISDFVNEIGNQFTSVKEVASAQKPKRSVDKETNRTSLAEIQYWFEHFESKAQLKIAQLEKEMLVEITSRLKSAAAIVEEDQPEIESPLSRTFRKARDAELRNYQWRIRLAELKEQFAKSRLTCLAKLPPGAKFELVMDSLAPDGEHSRKTSLDLNLPVSLVYTKGLRTGESGIAESVNGDAVLGRVLPHIEFGTITSFPAQFANSVFGYQPVQLADYVRGIRSFQSRANSSFRSPVHPFNCSIRATS